MDAIVGLYRILAPGERVRVAKVVAVATLAGLMEMVAVFSVMPFVAAANDPTGAMTHPAAARVVSLLGLEGERSFLFLVGAAVLLLLVVANLLGVLSLRMVHRTAWDTNHALSHRLLGVYLRQPYAWFLDRHSSRLSRGMLDEVNQVVGGVMLPLLYAMTRGVGALFLVALLVVVDSALTLVVGGLIGGAYVLIYRVIRSTQDRMGEQRIAANQDRFQIASEALGGIKELKSLGVEDEFLNRFDDTGDDYARTTARNLVLAEVPRYLLEVLAVGTVVAILLLLITAGQDLSEALPLLSLFAFAGYKLVPAFHQVFTGLARARFHLPSLREVQADLAEGSGREEEAGAGEDGVGEDGAGREGRKEGSPSPPLRIREGVLLDDVTFRYQGADRAALDRVSLEIPVGARIGVVGPTGAGKTTLVDLLLGLLEVSEGALRVDGAPVRGSAREAWRRSVGYVPQSIFLLDDTVARNIAFGVPDARVDLDRVEEVARMAELHRFVEMLPEGYGTFVGERGVRLSGGQRQRIGIARALYRDPSLLLLDEATSALDGATEEAVMGSILDLGRERTLVIVAHRLSTVRECDRIVLLEDARIVDEGSYPELLERSELFRAMARAQG